MSCVAVLHYRYILKCISQYGDNQFYGKFKQLYPDTAEIVTQIPSAGRSRRISIAPRPPPVCHTGHLFSHHSFLHINLMGPTGTGARFLAAHAGGQWSSGGDLRLC